ncbi:hypothetical protein G6645_08575 [Polynucleobacter paneuropaeus]|nr:hypothetical protein [Polynucleobacter paneuropaeus]MBT8532384.1 hypothetical protein [Polynucleobacter paneuropaeus]MBT8602598.1 hypothetical protein [Polynucleobacter paneuropaeus]MBT8624786.1 hypothetical protein [Polynucleobacter paneuropaeus]MBT8630103.1 hypothetical protein [Polynucleobacter paneuropaeus]
MSLKTANDNPALEIVDYLQSSWKKLALAGLVGAVLGLSGWFILESYTAEYVLFSNTISGNNQKSHNQHSLDLLSWKILQKRLPILAAQIVENNQVPEGLIQIYKSMEDEQWWRKNVVPTYAISRTGVKDFSGIGKNSDSDSSEIIYITLKSDGKSKEQSLENVGAVAKFILSSGWYFELCSLINRYDAETIVDDAELQKKIANTKIEMSYKEESIRQLEQLYKRFPDKNLVYTQPVDVKGSEYKYLPIQTQIITTKADLNASNEILMRLQKRLNQAALTRKFLDQALPLQDKTHDGLVLSKQLLEIESNLRAKLDKSDSGGAEFLNDLHVQLLDIQSCFLKSWADSTEPTLSSKRGIIKAVAGGLVGGVLLMLLVLSGERVRREITSNKKYDQL